MRITIESNYAIMIIAFLASSQSKQNAKTISENTGVTLRFTLKILRKLCIAKLVRSYKGSHGGYELAKNSWEISFKDTIEAVDGPIDINRCENNCKCNKAQNPTSCEYFALFADVSDTIRNKLSSITFDKKPLQ